MNSFLIIILFADGIPHKQEYPQPSYSPSQDDTYHPRQPNSAQFPSSQPYLRCPQGGGDLPRHPMHMPAASGYPPHPSTLHPSRCQPQQTVASAYPPTPSDTQASRYLPQQPVPLASGYPQSPYGREYSPQQHMPFPGYPPARSSAYGSGYLPTNVPPTIPFQGK